MDIKLENLKNNILSVCVRIDEGEIDIEAAQEILYEITGEIDKIKEDYEERKQRIKKLLD